MSDEEISDLLDHLSGTDEAFTPLKRAINDSELEGRVAALRLAGHLVTDMVSGRIDPSPEKLAAYLHELAEEQRAAIGKGKELPDLDSNQEPPG